MKTRTLRSTAIALAAAASLSACGGSNGGSSPVTVAQSSQVRDTSPAVPAADASELAGDNSTFAISLYQTLRASAGGDDNLVFSPTSISIALAMLYNGAENNTATGIATALDFTLPVDRLNVAFDALDLALTTPAPGGDNGAFQLSLANGSWVQQGFSIVPAYLDALAVYYGAGVNRVDFADDSARAAINAWVSGKTDGEIAMLLPPGSIDTDTRFVLTNAVYFHGDWLSSFAANSPDGIFHAAAGDVSVPMMSPQSESSNGVIWNGSGWSGAALPYQGGTTEMVLIVPDAGTFDAFEQGLTADALAGMLAPAQMQSGAVAMPRFKFSLATSLAKYLGSLGMTDAFVPGVADLSGIDGATDLYVSDVIHQADIAVDEKGTTAAAATAVVGAKVAIVITYPVLTVDRPFLFFIVHEPTGALLFAGRVVDPSTSS